ncbi:hypothetical protein DV735_g444, partial [Chaetothyriales sp. CBS 134920]
MSAPTSAPHGIFTADEIAALEADSIFLPGEVKGKRRFDRVTNLSAVSFELPVDPVSVEAMEFTGFTTPVATEIYEEYLSLQGRSTRHSCILDCAYDRFMRLGHRDISPSEAMELVGLNAATQAALLDPHFSKILWKHDMRHWISNTLMHQYTCLEYIQRLLKDHAHALGPDSAQENQQAVMDDPLRTVHSLSASQVTVVSDGGSDTLPGHTTLYTTHTIASMSNDGAWMDEDGTLIIRRLLTAGADFNYPHPGLYLTESRQVAEEYRAWTARRSPWSETMLIRIQVPDSFLSSLTTHELWYSADWKKYVWACKNSRYDHLLGKFDHLMSADLIRGHSFTGIDRSIKQHPWEEIDVHAHITEDNVMRVPGDTEEKAIQWAFLSNRIWTLPQSIRGKVHVFVSAPAALTNPSS